MAIEGQQPVKIPGAVAGADLTATTAQYKWVKFNGTGMQMILCSAVTDKPDGVLQAPAAQSAVGTPIEVVSIGETKLQSDGATVTANGQQIGPTASGQARVNVPGTDTTKFLAGVVASPGLSSPGAGVYFTAIVNCPSAARAA